MEPPPFIPTRVSSMKEKTKLPAAVARWVTVKKWNCAQAGISRKKVGNVFPGHQQYANA